MEIVGASALFLLVFVGSSCGVVQLGINIAIKVRNVKNSFFIKTERAYDADKIHSIMFCFDSCLCLVSFEFSG